MSSASATPGSSPQSRTARAMCSHCRRPRSVCYCDALARIQTRSRVVILQHPREHGMPIGTAHMAHLCLPRSALHVGVRWDETTVLRDACTDPRRPPVLLYPEAGARDILRQPPRAPVTLIVVDGTWSQARAVVRDNPRLAALPRYAFSAPEPSTYRIRREPSEAYVSTLEAIMHALGAIEGRPERFRALLAPMRVMVDAQLDAEAAAGLDAPRMRLRPKRATVERLPVEIRERYGDLVLVQGDANAWPWGTPERGLGDELVYWVALRPATGDTFEHVLAPRNPLAPDIPRHTGLTADDLESGGAVDAFLRRFAAFTRPADVICSWGHHALRMFKECGGVLEQPYLDLQRVAQDLDRRKTGSLDAYAGALADAHTVEVPRGRAGGRLRMLCALLDRWRGGNLVSESARCSLR